jgi:DNA-binding NarL/FixJ family response regulator
LPIGGHGGDHKSEEYQPDNIRLKADYGNSAEYTIRRLMRDGTKSTRQIAKETGKSKSTVHEKVSGSNRTDRVR